MGLGRGVDRNDGSGGCRWKFYLGAKVKVAGEQWGQLQTAFMQDFEICAFGGRGAGCRGF